MKKLPFSKSQTKARGPLDIVSSDVGGPVTPEGPGGIHYWVVLVDHWSSNVWVLFAKKKSQVYKLLKEWRKNVEAEFHGQIANWEFCNGWIRFFFAQTEAVNLHPRKWKQSAKSRESFMKSLRHIHLNKMVWQNA
jgi:hypothetical protein